MILIAYDGSEDAKHAVEAAAKLFPGSEATVLTVWHRLIDTMARTGMGLGSVVDYGHIDEKSEQQSLTTASEGAKMASDAGLNASGKAAVVETTVAEAVLHYASEYSASVVVIGTRGLGEVKSLLFGSVSHQVLQHADRPVLMIPSPQVAADRAAHRES